MVWANTVLWRHNKIGRSFEISFISYQISHNGKLNWKKKSPEKGTLFAVNPQSECPLFRENNYLSKSETFLKMVVSERLEFVRSNNVRLNCLTKFHRVKNFRNKFWCRPCEKSHHSLLHIESGVQNSGDNVKKIFS